jgi:hypothetical protein
MKKLNEENQKEFNNLVNQIGQTLISTMNALEIPNYISATYTHNNEKYTLNFKKESENK